MANKLTHNSKRVRDIRVRIEAEIERRPTRRIRLLRDFYTVWLAGLRGQVPPIFSKLVKDLDNTKDPEYSEYVRLKAKFE